MNVSVTAASLGWFALYAFVAGAAWTVGCWLAARILGAFDRKPAA